MENRRLFFFFVDHLISRPKARTLHDHSVSSSGSAKAAVSKVGSAFGEVLLFSESHLHSCRRYMENGIY